VLPPGLMAADNRACPETPTSARAVVSAVSTYGIAEMAAELAIDGRETRRLTIVPESPGSANFVFDIDIPGDVAGGGNVGARVRVTSRDGSGRTAEVSTTFTITRCLPPTPVPSPTPSATPTPRGLALSWAVAPPAAMTADNFYCPATVEEATAVVQATGDLAVTSLAAAIAFDTGGPAPLTFPLPVTEDPATRQYSIDLDAASFAGAGGADGLLTVSATDSEGNNRELTATVTLAACSLAVTWQTEPGGTLAASSALCPGTPESVQGVAVVSVPGVVEDGGVTASVSGPAGSGFAETLAVTPLGGGAYALEFVPGMLGVTYTGPATITLDVVDTRGAAHTLTAAVTLADCTMDFTWITLPDSVVAGSNAKCPAVPVRTSGFVGASLPDAVDTVAAVIEISGYVTPFRLDVQDMDGGVYRVDIEAGELPAVTAAATVRVTLTDIAAGTHEVTTPVQIQDCRGTLTWLALPPPRINLTACSGLPSLPFDVSFQAEIPDLVMLGAVTADGINELGRVVYGPIISPSPGVFTFTVDQAPPGTSFVVRAFAPDHKQTPAIITRILPCDDDNDPDALGLGSDEDVDSLLTLEPARTETPSAPGGG